MVVVLGIQRVFQVCQRAKEPNDSARGSDGILSLDGVSLRDAIDGIGSVIMKSVGGGNKAGTFGMQDHTSQDSGRA